MNVRTEWQVMQARHGRNFRCASPGEREKLCVLTTNTTGKGGHWAGTYNGHGRDGESVKDAVGVVCGLRYGVGRG